MVFVPATVLPGPGALRFQFAYPVVKAGALMGVYGAARPPPFAAAAPWTPAARVTQRTP